MQKKEKGRKRRIVTSGFFDSMEFKKYFLWAIVVILLFLSYKIIRPYFIALISAFVLAYLMRPVCVGLERGFGRKISALICVFIVILIILVPIGLVLGGTVQQVNRYFSGGDFDNLMEKISSYPFLGKLGEDLGLISGAGGDISFSPALSLLTSAISYVPGFVISLFIMVFGMYFILAGWDKLSADLKRYIPFKNKDEVTKDIAEITNTIVYGTFFMALIEFVIAAFGFYILGLNFYLLLAVLVFFFAFIPAIGPAIVWIPASIYFFVIGDYYTGGGLIVLGLILSVVVDTVLRAKMLGDKSKINPLVMIIGILGGLSVFGIFGFVIGPLILLYTIEILQEVMTRN